MILPEKAKNTVHLIFHEIATYKNFKTIACMVFKLSHITKSVTNVQTEEQSKSNMPQKLLLSWWHKK